MATSYALSPMFKPQFIGSSAAALTFAPAGGAAVPSGHAYQISVAFITNVGAATPLAMWRVPSGGTNSNDRIIVPSLTFPVASVTFPYMELTVLWDIVLAAGDAIWAQAGAGSRLIIVGDGIDITL